MNLPLNKYFKGSIKFHSVLLSYIAAFLFNFHIRCLSQAEEERKNCKDLTQVNEKADTRRCQGNIIPLLFLTFFLSGWQLQDSECQTLENILAEVASAPLAYFLSSCIGSFRFVQVYHMTRVQMGCLGCFVFPDAISLLLTFYSKETYVQTCMWKVVCAHNFTPVRGFPQPLSRFFASIQLGFLQGP